MSSDQLRAELKRLIVKELNLKGRDPSSIEEQLHVRIPEGEEARAIFKSVRAIADYVARAQAG